MSDELRNSSSGAPRVRVRLRPLLCCVALHAAFCAGRVQAQPQNDPSVKPDARYDEMERRLNGMTAALEQTRQSLLQSLQQIQQMQSEIEALRGPGQPAASEPGSEAAPETTESTPESSSVDLKDEVKRLGEEQQAMQAEIRTHEQSKVETSSKFPLRVTGLVLFNAFSNAGVVDDIDLPSVALARPGGVSHGSVGASMRQTVLGFDATGPHVWGARSAADASVDFFGGLSGNSYGSPAGTVRLRRAAASLDWTSTTLEAGMREPLISPLSPTSYATVAQPGLSWSGNLWVWSSQLRLEQRVPLPGARTVGLEAGLWDPQPVAINSSTVQRTVSAGERARRLGYEGRVSYRAGTPDRALALGVGGYRAASPTTPACN